jgi:hypothetical protein
MAGAYHRSSQGVNCKMNARLKLVSNQALAVKERNFVGVVHRAAQQMSDRKRNLTRRYASLDNAVVRLTEFMVRDGYIGDVCELYHHVTGRQLGTIKVTAKGHLKATWLWETKDV